MLQVDRDANLSSSLLIRRTFQNAQDTFSTIGSVSKELQHFFDLDPIPTIFWHQLIPKNALPFLGNLQMEGPHRFVAVPHWRTQRMPENGAHLQTSIDRLSKRLPERLNLHPVSD